MDGHTSASTNAGTSLVATALAAMREAGFQPEFSRAVLEEVIRLPDAIADPFHSDLRDLRMLPWSSIDNRSSRDLDQIEVAEHAPDGAIRVRIGVAEVGARVPLGSVTDAWAAANT